MSQLLISFSRLVALVAVLVGRLSRMQGLHGLKHCLDKAVLASQLFQLALPFRVLLPASHYQCLQTDIQL